MFHIFRVKTCFNDILTFSCVETFGGKSLPPASTPRPPQTSPLRGRYRPYAHLCLFFCFFPKRSVVVISTCVSSVPPDWQRKMFCSTRSPSCRRFVNGFCDHRRVLRAAVNGDGLWCFCWSWCAHVFFLRQTVFSASIEN